MHRLGTAAGLALALLVAGGVAAAAPLKTEITKAPVRRGAAVAPLPKAKAKHVHAAFEGAQCGVCHQKNDPARPGPIRHASVNEQCFECHDDVKEVMARKVQHKPAVEACTNCHNPHNSVEPALLAADAVELCTRCHWGIKRQLTRGKVQHAAVTREKKCANCHNPHAANIERLLIALPYDLCMRCHGKDGVVAADGKKMTNLKTWLDENHVLHDPVRAKDCSACHRTHAGDNYRLLVAEYPKEFYRTYDRKSYALCYSCHNIRVLSTPETTTLTAFRDGARNLHYVHVNRENGRSCRACHEVHASKQDHHIREGVPYGSKGYVLKVGYTRLPTGGSCVKTCHAAKSYDNTLGGPSARK